MKHLKRAILTAFAGVFSIIGICGDAADLFVPVASSSNGALTGRPKERLVHIAHHELAVVRDRVTFIILLPAIKIVVCVMSINTN